jgi:hypothetical protein
MIDGKSTVGDLGDEHGFADKIFTPEVVETLLAALKTLQRCPIKIRHDQK